jgi:hypothetical protein
MGKRQCELEGFSKRAARRGGTPCSHGGGTLVYALVVCMVALGLVHTEARNIRGDKIRTSGYAASYTPRSARQFIGNGNLRHGGYDEVGRTQPG